MTKTTINATHELTMRTDTNPTDQLYAHARKCNIAIYPTPFNPDSIDLIGRKDDLIRLLDCAKFGSLLKSDLIGCIIEIAEVIDEKSFCGLKLPDQVDFLTGLIVDLMRPVEIAFDGVDNIRVKWYLNHAQNASESLRRLVKFKDLTEA